MEQTKLSILSAIIATFLCGIIIFLERGLPFFLFSKKEPPKIISAIERFIPPVAMTVLLSYCLKDLSFEKKITWIPSLAALFVTVILHLWKKNALISIFLGTILYMILIKIF